MFIQESISKVSGQNLDKMPLWKLMPDRFVEQGEEAQNSQSRAFLWSIVFLFLFTCSVVLIFAIIQKVNPELLHRHDSTFSSNHSISNTNDSLKMTYTNKTK